MGATDRRRACPTLAGARGGCAQLPHGFSNCSAVGKVPQPAQVSSPTECEDPDAVWYATRVSYYDPTKTAAATYGRRLEEAPPPEEEEEEEEEVVLELASEAEAVDTGRRLAETVTSVPASTLMYGRYADDVRSTSGIVQKWNNGDPRRVVETFGTLTTLNRDGHCYYLDSSFCAPLHDFKRSHASPDAARALLRGLAWTPLALALASALAWAAWVLLSKQQRGANERRPPQSAVLDHVASMRTLPVVLAAVLFWTPIALEIGVLRPCWDCWDLQAVMTREIGHVLGFGIPDFIVPVGGYPGRHQCLQWQHTRRRKDARGRPRAGQRPTDVSSRGTLSKRSTPSPIQTTSRTLI